MPGNNWARMGFMALAGSQRSAPRKRRRKAAAGPKRRRTKATRRVRPAKGSAAAKRMMARLRAMRRR